VLDTSLPTIALAHNPDSVDKLKNTDVKLLLADHTHSGQVNIPLLVDWALRGATDGNFKQGLYLRSKPSLQATDICDLRSRNDRDSFAFISTARDRCDQSQVAQTFVHRASVASF
jgi:hypothetical protein